MANRLLDRVLTLPRKKEKGNRSSKSERGVKRGSEGAKHSPPQSPPSLTTKILAWCVHLYTAMGLVCAAGMAVALFQGGPNAFKICFGLMALATIIDSTDGTLARRIRIKEVIPNFDGRRLDDITDWLTYTVLPLVLIWRAELLPAGTEWLLVVPLLASAYGFCQTDVKTEDGYFLGFPSLWNVVAFYLYVLQIPTWTALVVVLVLALMTFVPSRYLYPSQGGKLNLVANILGTVWTIALGYLLLKLPNLEQLRQGTADRSVVSQARLSTLYPAFYMAASWAVTLRIWLRGPRPTDEIAAAVADAE